MKKQTFIFSGVCVLGGLLLVILALTGKVDSFWVGMGSGVLTVGALQMIRYIRYRKDNEYRQEYDIEAKDERNRYLVKEAMAWAYNGFYIVAAIAVVVLKLLGDETLMMGIAASLGMLILLFTAAYLWLRARN